MSQAGSTSSASTLFQNSLQVIRGPIFDMTTLGTTDIYTFPADFVICGIKYTITSLTGVSSVSTILNVGYTAPDYDDIINSDAGLPQFINDTSGQFIYNGVSEFPVTLAGETLKVNVTQAESGASVMTARVDIIGYYYTGSTGGGGGGSSLALQGDSGGPIQPIAGIWNVLGGTGVNVVGTAGTLTINAPAAGLTYTDVTGTTQAMATNNGYTANNAGVVTFTLPGTAAYGTIMEVVGKGAGGWSIAQNAGQTIHFNSTSTTTGVGGSLASTVRYNTVRLLCTVANTDWTVIASEGNITVV